MVVVGAGLCIRSLQKQQAIDAGFDPARVLVMSADLSLSGYDNERGLRFYSDLQERVGVLRGVEASEFGGAITSERREDEFSRECGRLCAPTWRGHEVLTSISSGAITSGQ